MKSLSKNCLLLSKKEFSFCFKKYLSVFLFTSLFINGQIANYVNNGGFEQTVSGLNPPIAKYWRAIDSTKYFGTTFSSSLPPFNVPLNGNTYQWPKNGANYFGTTIFLSTGSMRGYPLNRLKKKLIAGNTYCVRFHCNITNQSSYGIDAIGAYFGSSQIDTITKCTQAISYLTPQIQNQTGNIITDTLNWIPITGTFVANGTEKYIILGNFKSDVATNTILINPTNLPEVFCDVLFDDVSCIDINLPAFAGRDTIVLPGKPVFLGREPDVGIDEACIWYKLPDLVNPIDTVAGFWINPTTTSTYVVKQQLWCGNDIRWDTVVVETSIYVGNASLNMVGNNIQIFPNPADNYLEIKIKNKEAYNSFQHFTIYDHLGQLVREEEFTLKIKTDDLSPGVYFLKIIGNNVTVSRRFVIAR